MGWGIQRKLVVSLVMAGLLPLLLALAVVVWSVVTFRTQSVGRTFARISYQQADHLATLLSAQIDFIGTINYLPGTADFLLSANEIPPLSEEQIEQIEAAWPALSEEDPLLAEILDNRLSERWQAVQELQPRFVEVMVTDASGRLVAATHKTTDYFQADEQWWQDCYADGSGNMFLTEVIWDESAVARDSNGALVTDLCMPIFIRGELSERELIGILKVSIDAHWLVDQLDRTTGPEESLTWLVHATGEPATGAVRRAPVDRLPEAVMQYIRSQQNGWLIAPELEGLELAGFSAVTLPRRQRQWAEAELEWYVIVAASRGTALRPVYQMVAVILAIGLTTILLCFVAGLIIARREVLRPLLALSRGAGELARGNISFRLPVGAEAGSNGEFRNDEIGGLASDFNQMADELRRHVEELEAANRRKQQFIDLASHELRTPVTYILGMSQLARQSDAAPPHLLQKIHQKAQRLAHIVENMFKLLHGGTFEQRLHLVPLDLGREVAEIVRELEPFIQSRRQRCDLQVEENLPTLRADREKVRDILSNLISNAVRFSPDGQTITIRLSRSANSLVIVISDRGPGIPSEDLPHLFEHFFTVSSELSRHSSGEFRHLTRGMGLGLSVVKRFVEMHGGTVRVETGPAGTSVFVALPLEATGAPEEANPTPAKTDGVDD